MDNYADGRDFSLLHEDRFTFSVLRRIIEGRCSLLLTDHEKLIICFTCDPFPVWVWTRDAMTDGDMERAFRLLSENGLLDGRHRFNVKHGFARFFISRAGRDGMKLSVSENLLAYECPEPSEPQIKADGGIRRCTDDDLDEVTAYLDAFTAEIGHDRRDPETCRKEAKDYIDSGCMYFWTDTCGNSAATCKYGPAIDGMATVNFVYTRPECRRRHYAQNLVYRVTVMVREAGLTPVLYTNADYAPSNACYSKIGYRLRGGLCTVQAEEKNGSLR